MNLTCQRTPGWWKFKLEDFKAGLISLWFWWSQRNNDIWFQLVWSDLNQVRILSDLISNPKIKSLDSQKTKFLCWWYKLYHITQPLNSKLIRHVRHFRFGILKCWRVKFKDTFHFTIRLTFLKYDAGKILDFRNWKLAFEITVLWRAHVRVFIFFAWQFIDKFT